MEFKYNTAEAAGQNMVTMATDAACRWIWKITSPKTRSATLWRAIFAATKTRRKRPSCTVVAIT